VGGGGGLSFKLTNTGRDLKHRETSVFLIDRMGEEVILDELTEISLDTIVDWCG